MGIPSFYRWLIENFPKVLENNLNGEIKFNNLYIDFNGIIHNAIKMDNENNKSASLLTMKSDMNNDKIKQNIFYRLNQMIKNVNPTSLIYIGVDGVPPRAKAIEQRKRRFKSSKESVDVIIKMLKAKQLPITRDAIMNRLSEVFDSNSISPATEFIEMVDQWILEFVEQLSVSHPHLSIIVSNSTVPGEGEHKIMDYIRNNHSNLSNEKDGMSHVFYGMDADLIFLGLSSHLSNFYIIRDPISLLSCGICKAVDDHSNYECKSAYAMKKQFQKKSTSVLAKQIPISCSEQDIHNIFKYYGNIKIHKVEKSNTKKQTLNAYIEFENEDIINEISTRGQSFSVNNERISIQVEYTDDIFKPRNENGQLLNEDGEVIEEPTATTTTTTTDSTCTSATDNSDEPIPENAVFVVGLDSLVSRFDITTFFERFGEIESFQLNPSPRFTKQQYCMVKFKSQEAAQLAIKSTGMEFFGTKIPIKRAQIQARAHDGTFTCAPKKEKVVLSEQEKAAKDLEKEIEKERKRAIKDEKADTLFATLQKDDPTLSRETVVFYLGFTNWNIEKASETYHLFNKASLTYSTTTASSDQSQKKKVLYDYVNIDTFRSYLEYYLFEKLDKSLLVRVDFNRCINDITVLCFLLGNDFLPHLPSVGIQSGSIELIMCWYRSWIQNSLTTSNGTDIKYITNQHSTLINFENIISLLDSLTLWESTIFPENLEKQVKKDFIKSNKKFDSAATTATTGTSPSSNGSNIHTLKELTIEDSVPEFIYNDLIYYRVKLGMMESTDEQVQKVVEDMCYQYTLGLHWVLRYYNKGVSSWEWSYPYHYAPLAKDLLSYNIKLSKMDKQLELSELFKFNLGEPLKPLVHLTSVLPRNSISFLPDPLKSIMNEDSPFAASYRDDYKLDLNGENVAWKAIVLLDFMDPIKLRDAITPIIENELNESDKKRNRLGQDYKIKNGKIESIIHLLSGSGVNGTNGNEEVLHVYQSQTNSKLTVKDLTFPTRNYFTMSPFPSSDISKFISIPTAQAPLTDHSAPAMITKEQANFIEWRKSKTGFNQSLEILNSIDFSKSACLNYDKKNSLNSGSNIENVLGRLLNNEYSSNNEISIVSIDDSQLILNIAFKQPVKLNSIKIVSTSTASTTSAAPKVVKVYTNTDSQSPNIDFSIINNLTPKCIIEYSSPSDLQDYESTPPYNFTTTSLINSPFKSVSNLVLFVESNFSTNNSTTIIEKIILS